MSSCKYKCNFNYLPTYRYRLITIKIADRYLIYKYRYSLYRIPNNKLEQNNNHIITKKKKKRYSFPIFIFRVFIDTI